ncbi:MAG: hypothetical protein ABJV04_03970 [Aliiglaciecola sp.]|uniref:hypothetical protein n=1 Tax=Aliiglaciecola sp. TaxID=1872441 RepID=UPI0032984131
MLDLRDVYGILKARRASAQLVMPLVQGSLSLSENNIEGSLYAPPQAELASSGLDNAIERNAFYVVSPSKLIILSFCTFNLYLIFWFYRNWKLQKDNANFPCIPILRAIFNLFFVHSLYAQVNDALQSKSIHSKASGFMATFYLLTILVSIFSNQWEPTDEQLASFVLVFFATVALQILPIWYVQGHINQVCDDPQGRQNSQLSLLNWVFILLGIVYWGFVFVGIFMSYLWQ